MIGGRQAKGAGFFGLVAGAMVLAAPAGATDWVLAPHLRLNGDYINNPRLATHDSPAYTSSSGEASAEASSDIAYHGEQLDTTIAPRVLYDYYPNDTILNQDDQYLDLKSSYKTELSTWALNGNLARDTTLTSELGLTGLSETNKRHESLNISGGPTRQLTERWSVSGQAAWQANHYSDSGNTGLLDYRYSTVDLGSQYALTETLQGAIDVSVGRLGVQHPGQQTRNYAGNASLTDRLDEHWTLVASAGASRVHSSSGGNTGALFALSAQHTGELLTLGAKISRDVTPTGNGALSRRDQATLTATRALSERLSADLSLAAVRNRTLLTNGLPQVNSEKVLYTSVAADLAWRLSETWTTSFAVRHDQQDIEDPSAHARGYRVGLSIIWNGNPWALR